MNKLRFIILFFSVSAVCLMAEEPTEPSAVQRARIIESMNENVQVYSDTLIDRLLLDKINGTTREQVQIQGYRVQVFSSNQQQTAKTEAFRVEKLITESTIESPTYVLYNPPFWKVRVGNFRTQEEAQLMKEEIVRILPELQGETYVVRDQIQVIQ